MASTIGPVGNRILSFCGGEKLQGQPAWILYLHNGRFPSTLADNRRTILRDRAAVAKRPGQFPTPAFQSPRHPSQGELFLLASTISWAKGNIMSTKLVHSIAAPDMPRMFFAESHASTSQECQRKAVECLRLVQTLLDSTNKAILLEMADAWISFAEQQKVEVNSTPKRAAY
jgi:hypothetical protein